MSDSRIQEIVTRAVVGRAERRLRWEHQIPSDGITGVLGAHVADTAVAVRERDGQAVVDLLVDCDLWCTDGKHTKVIRSTSRHTEAIDIHTVGTVLGEVEIRAKVPRSARATDVTVQGESIGLQLAADVAVEMTALARMWVKAYDLNTDVLDDLDYVSDDSSSSSSDSSSSSSMDFSDGYRLGE